MDCTNYTPHPNSTRDRDAAIPYETDYHRLERANEVVMSDKLTSCHFCQFARWQNHTHTHTCLR